MQPSETQDMNKWGSHLPALISCIVHSEGPVLEFGVGHFSTPQLHALCMALGRQIYSVDHSEDWMEGFTKLQNLLHDFSHGNYSKFLDAHEASGTEFGVAFIDHSDTVENRLEHFKRLSLISEFVVVHDFWHDNLTAIYPLLVQGNYHICKWYEPPTLVFSSTKQIPEEVLSL